MMRILLAALPLSACANTASTYVPHAATPSEMTLHYDGGLRVQQGARLLANGTSFAELPPATACVANANHHAQKARAYGRTSRVLRYVAGTTAVASLLGFAGLAQEDRGDALALLGAGLGVATASLLLGASAHSAEIHAQGHAVDAVNYWNDAMGFRGEFCP